MSQVVGMFSGLYVLKNNPSNVLSKSIIILEAIGAKIGSYKQFFLLKLMFQDLPKSAPNFDSIFETFVSSKISTRIRKIGPQFCTEGEE